MICLPWTCFDGYGISLRRIEVDLDGDNLNSTDDNMTLV